MEFKEETKEVLTKIDELIRDEMIKYKWGSIEIQKLGVLLSQLNDLRRKS